MTAEWPLCLLQKTCYNRRSSYSCWLNCLVRDTLFNLVFCVETRLGWRQPFWAFLWSLNTCGFTLLPRMHQWAAKVKIVFGGVLQIWWLLRMCLIMEVLTQCSIQLVGLDRIKNTGWEKWRYTRIFTVCVAVTYDFQKKSIGIKNTFLMYHTF